MIAVENGPGGIDLKLEAELAELPDDEAAAYRDGGESALDEIAGRLRDALDLITFFTAGEKETRAWTLRQGETALDAADSIHSDIARGFIRCEVVDWQDLVDARLARRGVEAGQAAARGQDVRRPRRRRPEHPLQRLGRAHRSSSGAGIPPGEGVCQLGSRCGHRARGSCAARSIMPDDEPREHPCGRVVTHP